MKNIIQSKIFKAGLNKLYREKISELDDESKGITKKEFASGNSISEAKRTEEYNKIYPPKRISYLRREIMGKGNIQRNNGFKSSRTDERC